VPVLRGTKAVEREEGYVAVEHDIEHVPDERRRTEVPKVFHCEDCGAEVTFEGATVSSTCPFCGAAHVVERPGEEGRILPESVIPFAVDQGKAHAAWKAWLGRGIFRPKELKDVAGEERLKGVYVPFWTFDARAWSRWTAEAGWHYYVSVPDGRGGTRREQRTRWEHASGQRSDEYDDVLIAAGSGLDVRMIEKVYPYRLPELQPYKSAYLSGWLAEEYAVGPIDGWHLAREKINAEQERRCARDVPGDTHRFLRVWTQHGDVTWKHLLLPLWIATYRYRDKTYRFVVNGQTGSIAGTKPVSAIRVVLAILVAAAVGIGLYFLLRNR
jgi:ribosomal protein S27E